MGLRKAHQGFTLIELLVVIAIIGLLSSIVLASLSAAREKGDIAATQSDLHSLQTAFELYVENHATYPPNSDDCSGCAAPVCDAGSWNAVVSALKSSGDMADPPATDPWGHPWCYDNNYNVPCANFPTKIWSAGPNGVNETPIQAATCSGDDICIMIHPLPQPGPSC